MVVMRKSDDSPKTIRGQIFTFIVEYKLANDGCAPSYQEIMAPLFIGGPSTIKFHIERLEKIGMIEKSPEYPRKNGMIQIVGGYQNAKKNWPEYFRGE